VKADQVIENSDFSLAPIEVATVKENTVFVMNNVFFEFDKAVLKPESFPELNRIVSFLGNQGGIEIEISGHTDAVGPEPYNLGLSQRRANAVKQYLIEKGVERTAESNSRF
jgi:OmpA-OmpF porin, OOP family